MATDSMFRLPIPPLRNMNTQHDLNHVSPAPTNPRTPRRMTLSRTVSSPPFTPVSPGSQTSAFRDVVLQTQSRRLVQDLLTPPISPIQSGQYEHLSISETPKKSASPLLTQQQSPRETQSISEFIFGSPPGPITPPKEVPLLEYPYELKNVVDETGKWIEFGSGAWSTVHKCMGRLVSSQTTERPTSSQHGVKLSLPLVVAVKTPHRKDGESILKSEARILSHLSRMRRAEDRVVRFHGFVSETSSLVMSAIPLSLADHIDSCSIEMRSMYKRSARNVPVVGGEIVWLSLATALIDSLQWLHDTAGVVHGDIKPHNILLRPSDPESDCETSYSISNGSSPAFPFTPLLIDFSSAHFTTSAVRSPGALSAVTPQYTAPELLSSKVLRDPTTLPTTAADIFSLAVTLLVCATGDMNVYPSPSAMQRQAMAQQGWGVIGFARSGENGSRVPRGGVVERVLESAVLKVGMGRCNAREWKAIVRERAKEMGEM